MNHANPKTSGQAAPLGLLHFHLAPAIAGSLAAVPATMTPIYLSNNIVGNMIGASRRPSSESADASDDKGSSPARGSYPAAPHPSPADLSVGHSRDVSAEVRQTFLAGVVRNNGQAIADDFDRQIGDVQSTFARAVAGYGLRANDFSDVMTAYMLMMWMAANQHMALPRIAQVNGVRAQLRPRLAGKIADARQRQHVAEMMMYQACILIAAREQAEQGRPQLLRAAASAIERSQGDQLRRLALTDQGLQ